MHPVVEVLSVSADHRRRFPIVLPALALMLLVAACSGTPSEGAPTETSAPVSTAQSATSPSTSTTVVPVEPIVVPDYTDHEAAYVEGIGVIALGRLNVLVDAPDAGAVAQDVAAALGGEVTGVFDLIGMYQVSLPDSSIDSLNAAIEIANAVPGVTGAAADIGVSVSGSTCESTSALNSSSYGQGDNAAHYEAIGLQNAWDIIAASGVELSDVHVGVADTAFMPASTEDEGDVNIRTPRGTTDQPDMYEGRPSLGNLNHGTAVAHVIAADDGNGGVAGVASPLGDKLQVTVDNIFDGSARTIINNPDPDNPAHIAEGDGQAYVLPTLQKVLRQVEEGATVINMSYGPEEPSRSNLWHAAAYRRFFERMAELHPNVVFVAAAGNESGELDGENYYPGGIDLPNVITVGAIDHTGDAARFSNTTSGNGEVTLAAPGVKVPVGVDPTTDQVFNASGTSFAAPMVTGAIALIQSINPDLTAAEVRQLLEDTARDGVAATGDADTSKLVPDSVGGRVMRVDEAVLAAINGARAAANPPQPPLDRDALLAAMSFSVEARPTGPGEFSVRAGVDGENQAATMSFELFGEGSVSGASSQPATSATFAEWIASPADPTFPASAKVCRTDASRCCVLTLEPSSVAGSYSGSLIVGFVEADGDLVVDTPDGEQTVSQEDCEDLYSDLIGRAFTVDLTLGDDGSGVSGPVTGSLYDVDGEPTETSPTTWTLSGSTVTIPIAFTDDGYSGTFVLTGTVAFDESGQPAGINGDWVLAGIPNLTLGGDFTLSRTG